MQREKRDRLIVGAILFVLCASLAAFIFLTTKGVIK